MLFPATKVFIGSPILPRTLLLSATVLTEIAGQPTWQKIQSQGGKEYGTPYNPFEFCGRIFGQWPPNQEKPHTTPSYIHHTPPLLSFVAESLDSGPLSGKAPYHSLIYISTYHCARHIFLNEPALMFHFKLPPLQQVGNYLGGGC